MEDKTCGFQTCVVTIEQTIKQTIGGDIAGLAEPMFLNALEEERARQPLRPATGSTGDRFDQRQATSPQSAACFRASS